MNDQAMKFRLGIFALGAVILLAILIILFGQFPSIVDRPIEYIVKFNEAPGIEPGTAVRKSGVRIGQVESVDLDPDTGEVTVRVSVDRKYQLRIGDKPSIGRNLIIGDATVNFDAEPKASKEPAPKEYVFQGELPDDIRRYLKDASGLVPSTQVAIEEFRATAKSVRDAMPEVRAAVKEIQIASANVGRAGEATDNFIRGNNERLAKAVDAFVVAAGNISDVMNEQNRKNLATALENVRKTSEQLDGITKQTQAFMTESTTTVKKVGDRIDSVAKNTDEFITETRNTVKNVGDNVQTLTKNADGFITETRTTVKTVGEQITTSAKNADALIADSRRTVQIAGDRVDAVGKQAEEFLKEGRLTMNRVNDTLVKTDEVMANLQTATRPLAEKAPVIMKNLEETTIRINQVAYNANDFLKALNSSEGTLRKLLTDPTLYTNVNDSVTAFNRSVARLDRIMADLAIFSDKIARRPELLGVSGAVAPSSGIKR